MAVKEKPNTPDAEKADAIQSAGFSCYIGPNITGVIQRATIYPAGRTEALKLPEVKIALGKVPGIAGLIVDGAVLPQGLIDIKNPETDLYKAYKKVSKK